jgi:hypothetical protein
MYQWLLATVKVSIRSLAVLSAASLMPAADGQTMKVADITQNSTLYVVPYAHLDTQWRWEFPQTISEYLLKTLRAAPLYDTLNQTEPSQTTEQATR